MSDDIVLTAQTNLISSEIDFFKKKIFEELVRSPERIILDLQKVRVLDSSGIGMLIAANNSAANVECELVFKAVNQDIMKMFKIMRLTDHFVFAD